IHKRIKILGLKESKAQNRIFFSHETARKIINLSVKPLKIATSVVKGGVGKTTIAEALAVRTCLYGLKVLCVDVDQQANFTKILSPIVNNYDLIIFDCPPTLGTTVCASILASDLIIAPLNPDVYSYEGIEIMDKEIDNIKRQFNKNIQWKILLNKFDSRTI